MYTSRADAADLLARLTADFLVHARFGDADVFESDEMLVFVRGLGDVSVGRATYVGRSVRAIVRRPVPVGSIPDHLFGVDDLRAAASGLLASAWQRRQELENHERRSGEPPPGWVSVPRRRRGPPL